MAQIEGQNQFSNVKKRLSEAININNNSQDRSLQTYKDDLKWILEIMEVQYEVVKWQEQYIREINQHLIMGKIQQILYKTNNSDYQNNVKLTAYQKFWEIIMKQYENFKKMQQIMLEKFKQYNNQLQTKKQQQKQTLSLKLLKLLEGVVGIVKSNGNFLKLTESNEKCRQLKLNVDQLSSTINQKQTQINRLKQTIYQKQDQIKALSKTINQKQDQIKTLQGTINNKQKQLNQLTHSISDRSQILTNRQNDEQFITGQLKNYFKQNQIIRYNKLYHNHNQIYLNSAIYNQPNTLLIIKTKLGHIIVGYSSLSYCGNKDMEESKGLLISTHSKKSYPLKQNQKPIKLNNKYLIFGNGQIIIKRQDDNGMEIDVDINENSVFDVGKSTNLQVIGEQNKKVQIQNYQIYQIIFKYNNNLRRKLQRIQYDFFPNRLFVGNVIQDQEDRWFIIDEVLKLHPKQKIIRTKLLYSFDLMNLINPHIKIDNIPNYIVIVTLDNKDENKKPYMMAMYSEKPLKPSDPSNNGNGFVASVNNRRVFNIIKTDKTARLTQYNQYFIVYGKTEIQFQIGKNYMQFNIGHIYKSLNTQNLKNPQIFCGKTDAKIEIIDYEIYQIIFETENNNQ